MSKKDISLTEAFQKLETVSDEISNPNLDLDQSVALLEEGLKLALICKTKLSEMENKVIKIQDKYKPE